MSQTQSQQQIPTKKERDPSSPKGDPKNAHCEQTGEAQNTLNMGAGGYSNEILDVKKPLRLVPSCR